MPKKKRCKVCGRYTKFKTRTGRCLSCMVNKNIAVNKQLKAKKGKWYQKWREATLNGIMTK